MFSPNKAGILTNCQLKIIEEVKKLVDEMKICTNATLTEQSVEKQNH